MKTIRKGKKHERKLKTTCNNCGSRLEESESKLRWESCPRGEELARAKCPECKHEIFFYR